MEELMKAMGIKPTEEMSLEEVRTQINDYSDFDDSLQEISEVLEINTGTYMQLQSIYEDNSVEIEKVYNARCSLNYKHLCRNPEELAYVLLAIFVRAHAKIGEIAFMLENDIDALNDREAEILDAMECREASEHFEDYMNEPSKQTTPCDYPDNDGHFSCPYDAQGGDDCRNWCGLGVDE